MITNPFRRDKSKKPTILELPAAEQKKMYKRAADESTKLQTEVLEKYEATFGERVDRQS